MKLVTNWMYFNGTVEYELEGRYYELLKMSGKERVFCPNLFKEKGRMVFEDELKNSYYAIEDILLFISQNGTRN